MNLSRHSNCSYFMRLQEALPPEIRNNAKAVPGL